MRKLIYILLLFPILLNAQPTTDLIFRYKGVNDWSDSSLVDSISGQKYKLHEFSADTVQGYIPLINDGYIIINTDTITLTCLFQNFNFADTLYFKIEDKTINSDSTINLPYRLTELSLYSSPQDANLHFETPFLQTVTMKTVCSVGCDYTDLTTAIASVSAGDTILLNTIKLSEGSYINANKAVVIIGVGNSQLINNGVSYQVLCNNDNLRIENINITAPAGGEGVFCNQDTRIKNCYIKSDGSWDIRTVIASEVFFENTVFNFNNTLNPSISNYSLKAHLNNCYFKGENLYNIRNIGDLDSLWINYCYFTNISASLYSLDDLDYLSFNFNTIRNNTSVSVQIQGSANTYLRYNNLNSSGTFINQTTDEGFVYLYKNTIVSNYNSPLVRLEGQNAIINNNTIENIGSSSCISIGYHSSNKTISINNNYLHGYASILVVGSETEPTEFNYIEGNITGNKVVGEEGVLTTAQHAIFLYNNNNFDINYNYVTNAGLTFVFKGENANYSTVNVFNNISDSGRVVIKGVDSVNIFNNTSYAGGNNICVDILNNGVGNDCNGVNLKNNIFYGTAPDTIADYALITLSNSNQTIISDYNNFYSNGGLDLFRIGSTDYTFSQWQGLGNDLNSFESDPNFKSSTKLYPINPSDVIGNGINLGSSYNTALDINTVFPTNIITKSQGAIWDIGAYAVSSGILMYNGYIIINGNEIQIID